MASQIISHNDAEEIKEVWIDGLQTWLSGQRHADNVDSEAEYKKQQEIYSNYAHILDKAVVLEEYSGPSRTAAKINSLYASNKEIRILDYGCGTGLVADFLSKLQFFNVDGFDSNQGMLDILARKQHKGMMASEIISYNNDDELKEIWTGGLLTWLSGQRHADNVDSEAEYRKQQEIYSNYAHILDKAVVLEQYSGPGRIAAKINSLYASNKEIKIFDYGCGTGLVADFLSKLQFSNVDGFDANHGMLDILARKQHKGKLFCGRNTDGLETIDDNTYDVVCSTGTFFVSASHPGTDCYEGLCRIIKPGGVLIVLTKVAYTLMPYVDFTVVDQLERNCVLKKVGEEQFEGYRKAIECEADKKAMGVIFTYKVL